jgi:hypothetical protein
MPYTTVVAGTAITASWSNANVRDQVVTPFASAAARASAVASPPDGMITVLTDSYSVDMCKAGSWVPAINAPICMLKQIAVQSVANATNTAITFTDEIVDTLGWHSTSTNTSRITPTVAGWYMVQGKVTFGTSTAGGRNASIWKNGVAIDGSAGYITMGSLNGSESIHTSLTMVYVNGTTDYIELYVIQNSGGAVNTATAVAEISSLTAMLVRTTA